jgi:thiol-disulfide isomerase/thioredoxin
MPDLDLVGLEGGPQRWSPRSGRVVVINFWATWCAPCRREMDSLERLAALGEAAGIEVVGVSVDDDPNLVREHVRRNGWAFARFIDHGRVASRGRLGIQALPRTYVVGPDGRIALVVDGPRDWTDAGMLARLMAMRARPGLAGY